MKKGWKILLKGIWFVIKIPYFISLGIYKLIKYFKKKSHERKIRKERESITANYESFKILKKEEGVFENWEKEVYKSDSKIGIILGSRGSGKTALGVKVLENVKKKTSKNCCAIGFKPETMPSWIKVVEKPDEVKNNSFVLIDEGGVIFNSRSSMSSANKLLSNLMLVARHKNISILFISQNSSNLDVNIIRQADFLLLKKSSLLQKDFERKIIQEIYKEKEKDFKKLKENKGLTYIYSDEFRGFVSNPLPSFWKTKISKSFK